ncbi:MAG: porin [Xanthobacteraceae bacterium]
MRKLILILALLPGAAVAAEQPKKPAPVSANPCAQYGPDFVQVKGSKTCVKVSGYIRIDVGR